MPVAGIFHQPFAEQLAYFRQKTNLGTEHWDDILGNAHDRSFIVAGAMKADLLTDLRVAVDKAIERGTTLDEFRLDFARIVEKRGWSYRGGFDWRTNVIYSTNLRASYAAGRWAQLNDPALAGVAPYWRYKHSDSVLHPRPLHVSWDGLTLPRGDRWWQTHFPPNGWGCKCRVIAVRAKDLRDGKPDKAPNDGTYTHVDRRGMTHEIPRGIDYGWAHAPGAATGVNIRQFMAEKTVTLDPDLSSELHLDMKMTRKPDRGRVRGGKSMSYEAEMKSAEQAVKAWIDGGRPRADNFEMGHLAREAGKAVRALEDAARATPEGVYWRGTNRRLEASDVKAGVEIISTDHSSGRREDGMSVARSLGTVWFGNYKYAYQVRGKIVGIGADGEPVLRDVKVIGKVLKAEEAVAKDEARERLRVAIKKLAELTGIEPDDVMWIGSFTW